VRGWDRAQEYARLQLHCLRGRVARRASLAQPPRQTTLTKMLKYLNKCFHITSKCKSEVSQLEVAGRAQCESVDRAATSIEHFF